MNDCSEVIKKLYDMRLVCAVYGDNEAIQTINDVIALLKEQEPRWIPVTERLPDEGNDVIAWEKQGFPYIDFVRGGEWVVASDQYAIVTHWMPLPEPPKEEDDVS